MDFNIRALCASQAIDVNATVEPENLIGRHIEFRSGITIGAMVDSCSDQVLHHPRKGRLLSCLETWVRVYKHLEAGSLHLHVIGTALDELDELRFYKADLTQPYTGKKDKSKKVATIAHVSEMSRDECTAWLIELAEHWPSFPEAEKMVLENPKFLRSRPPKIAITGNPVIEGVDIQRKLIAAGAVFGADVHFVRTTSFTETRARLRKIDVFTGGIMIHHGSPFLNLEVMPEWVGDDLLYEVDADGVDVILSEAFTALDLIVERHLELQEAEEDEGTKILRLILSAMISHSKIGQFSHCSMETLLSTVRAKRLNIELARQLVQERCDKFQDTRTSTALFLWKGHNEGPEYFLNPGMMNEIKRLAGRA